MKYTFPERPSGSVEELWRAVLDLLPQLESRVLTNRVIGRTETPIAHGLGFAPKSAALVPYADTNWHRSRAPDDRFVYFIVNPPGAVPPTITCDVVLFP